MDQARWLVILSVLLSMTVTLTLLQKFNRPAAKTREVSESAIRNTPGISGIGQKSASSRENTGVKRYREVTFSQPAIHTVAVDGQSEFARFDELLQREGKVME